MHTRKHAISAVALLFMLALAAGSQKPTPGEVEAGLAAAAGDKKILDDYVTKIGAVYKSLSAMNMHGLNGTRCDEAAMLKAAPPKKDDYGKIHAQRIFGPYMARFASKNAADWKKYDYNGTWDWLTDSSYGGHFESFPDTRDAYAIKDTARRVKEEFIPSRYIVVIWPTDAKNTMPIYHPKNESFIGGYFEGMVFVVDAIDNKVMCHSPLYVASGDLITYKTRGLLREKPEIALKDDFENRMKKELTTALPDAIDFGTMGTIF